MKKISKLIMLLTFAALMALSVGLLAACNGATHTHDWGAWEVTTPATCLEAGVETRVCRIDSSHTETRTIEALGHNFEWQFSEWGSWGEWTTTATCTQAGTRTRTRARTVTGRICTRCENAYQGTTQPDAELLTETESEGQEALGHDWGAWGYGAWTIQDADWAAGYGWNTTLQPTCTEDGSRTRTRTRTATRECERCDEVDEYINTITETEALDALGHSWGAWQYTDWVWSWQVTTPATTCTQDAIETGNATRTAQRACASCQTPYTGNTVPDESLTDTDTRAVADSALDHAWGEWQFNEWNLTGDAWDNAWGDNTATCTEGGEETRARTRTASRFCTRACCDNVAYQGPTTPDASYLTQTETRPSSALDHNHQWVVTTPATETEDGEESYKCERCLEVLHTRIIAHATGTAGLAFARIPGREEYSVSAGTVWQLPEEAVIFIPSFHNRLPVTQISDRSMQSLRANSITIGANIRHIGVNAFSSNLGLISVFFAQGSQLETIGQNAFGGAANLSSINLPQGLLEIDSTAFARTTSLLSISIPQTVVTLGIAVFNEWTSTQTIIFEGRSESDPRPSGWHAQWQTGSSATIIWGTD